MGGEPTKTGVFSSLFIQGTLLPVTDVVEGDSGRNVPGTKSLVSGSLGEKQARLVQKQ